MKRAKVYFSFPVCLLNVSSPLTYLTVKERMVTIQQEGRRSKRSWPILIQATNSKYWGRRYQAERAGCLSFQVGPIH